MNNKVIEEIFFSEKIDRLNNMMRWNGFRKIKEESVAEHTYIVTLFTRAILEELIKPNVLMEFKYNTLTYAMLHDFDEIFTGDISHELKYNSFNGDIIKHAVDAYIKNEISENGIGLNDSKTSSMIKSTLNNENGLITKIIVKIADWLSMCLYIKNEIRLGNKGFRETYSYCVQSLIEKCDELINTEEWIDLDMDYDVIRGIKQIQFFNKKR